MRHVVTILLLAVAFCQALPAAQSWEDVRALRPGATVRIRETGGAERSGAISAVTADDISLDGGKVRIERSRIRSVAVRRPSRRVRNAVIGAGIGLAVALVVDNSLGTYFRNEAGESAGARAVTYIAPIGLFGALGAAISPYRTIYKAK